jgi:hypothetical protein
MFLRQHLRAWTMLALVLQSAWLFAIVPGACCVAHESPKKDAPCQEEVKVERCAMHAVPGAACPMHQKGEQPPSDACAMRTACDGPMASLLSMLAVRGILPTSQPALPAVGSALSSSPPGEQLVSRFVPPESPPPRA